jgi:hypothetical protein
LPCDLAHVEVDLLHAVAIDPDREHQEGHQDRQRVQAESEHIERSELPHQRGQRAGDRQEREAQRAAVPVNRRRHQQQRDAAEQQHRLRPVGDLAHLLGEADDLDAEMRVLELVADPLVQQAVVGDVIDLDAVAVVLVQLRRDQRTALITGDQQAVEAAARGRALDFLDQLRRQRRRLHRVGDQLLVAEAFRRDLHQPGIRRPQRLHAEAVHVRHRGDGLRDLVKLGQPLLGPDLAVDRAHGEGQAVGAEQLIAVLVEGLDVLVPDRHLLLEAGLHSQLHREEAHHQREGGQHAEHQNPAREGESVERREEAGQCRRLRVRIHRVDSYVKPSSVRGAGAGRAGGVARPGVRCVRT